MSLPEDPATRASWLVARLGGHLASELGIALDRSDDDEALRCWLVATSLHAPRADERIVVSCFRAIAGGSLDVVVGDPLRVEALLQQAGHPRPAETAALLSRLLGRLREAHGGSLRRLLASAETLEQLGGALASLAPGFGRAAVTRFLQPLREGWAVCADLPLDPAALPAAEHLGLVPEGTEPEFAAEALARAIGDGGPALRDIEAALARLGRRACRRGRAASCPLDEDCPLA